MASKGFFLPCAAAILAALFAFIGPVSAQGRGDAYQEHYETVPADPFRDRGSGNSGNRHGDWAPDGTFTGNGDDDADTAPDAGEDVADVAYFHGELDTGGAWIRHPRYNVVWRPAVDARWRPYTLGRWAYSDDYGWTWISDEPFGWAVYHYGRWGHDRAIGWFWRPGTEWAPAWVAWRQGEDVIGWAPLPPSARFVGGRMTFNTALLDREDYEPLWVFVRPRHLVRPDLSRFLRPRSWNAELMVRSQPRVALERASDRKWRRVVNRGLSPQVVERLSGVLVPRVRIVPVDEPRLKKADRFDRWRAREKREVRIYRPDRRRTERARSEPGAQPGTVPWRAQGDGLPSTFSRTVPADRPNSSVPRDQAGTPPVPGNAAKAPPPAATPTYDQPPPAVNNPRRDWTSTGAPRSAGSYAPPEQREPDTAAQSGDDTSGTIPVRPARSTKRWDRSGPSGAPTAAGAETDSQD